jgi:hypothetical protein
MGNEKNQENSHLSIAQIEAAIDNGSEEAARALMKYLVHELLNGRPILKRFSIRLGLGLGKIIDEGKCLSLLSLREPVKKIWAKKYPEKYISIDKKPGPKHKTLDEDLKIFVAVQEAYSNTKRLRSSRNKKPGAFSLAGDKFNLSERAIEKRYYRAKNIIEKIFCADEEAKFRKQ